MKDEIILATGLGSVDRYNVADLVGQMVTFSNTKKYKERNGMIVSADAEKGEVQLMTRVSPQRKSYTLETIKGYEVISVNEKVDVL